MKKDIEIVRGTTNTFEITVTDANGNLYTLASGEKLLFGVKKKHTDTEYLFVKSVTSGENGMYAVTITPEDTQDYECGCYCYDVAIESGTAFYNVIPTNTFTIGKNVTKWGCG